MSEKFGTLNQQIDSREKKKLLFNNKKDEIRNRFYDLAEHQCLSFLPKELKGNLLKTFDKVKKDVSEYYVKYDQLELLNLINNNIDDFFGIFNVYVDLMENYKNGFNLEKIHQRVTIPNRMLMDEIDENNITDSELNILKDYLEKQISAQNVFTLTTVYNCKTLMDAEHGAINQYINESSKKIDEELRNFRKLRNIADNALTENIYDQAVTKYRGLEKDYRWYFYWALGLTVGISLGTFFLKNIVVPDFLGNVEFWVLKASIVVVGITLITYFLKQSAHYQRLADQNYQTQVELQAYPSFMESIPTGEAASVRKELALKYFGREIDGAAHKDMSNLIFDQMKSTTEMVKAATDVLKAKG